MIFTVKARVLMELGSELISSDSIAIYELVKNSLDAGSKRTEVEFQTVLPHSAFVHLVSRLRAKNTEAELAKFENEFEKEILPDAPEAATSEFFQNLSDKAGGLPLERLTNAYRRTTWIRIRDLGRGMSLDDIRAKFLVVGTPNRLIEKKTGHSDDIILGEKGLGRLSSMRLGGSLMLTTATLEDTYWNKLDVDWTILEDQPNLNIDEFLVSPYESSDGPSKPKDVSGTEILISHLYSDWNTDRLNEFAGSELAKLQDNFDGPATNKRLRFSINGQAVPVPFFEHKFLKYAHGHCHAELVFIDGSPRLVGGIEYLAEGRSQKIDLDGAHLRSVAGESVETRRKRKKRSKKDDSTLTLPANVTNEDLRSLGPFKLKMWWFNRQRLTKDKMLGYQDASAWVKNWGGGLLLYRDGFRVYPYGSDQDDWLNLDRAALASSGYKVNRAQIVGRIAITSRDNLQLRDQTNREGLRDSLEKSILINLARFVLIEEFKTFIQTVDKDISHVDESDVDVLEKKMARAETGILDGISRLTKVVPKEEIATLSGLVDYVTEIKQAWERNKKYCESLNDDIEKYLHLAGVGLMMEFVIHELRRSVDVLLDQFPKKLTGQNIVLTPNLTLAVTKQLQTLHKRLRVLDPMAVPGRQVKSAVDVGALISGIVESHENQFARHRIKCEWSLPPKNKLVVEAVTGQIIQIIENLIQNSVFWLDEQEKSEPLVKKIIIVLDVASKSVTIMDNGPGISETYINRVFEAFFTTKGQGQGRGLGLFISRKLAEDNNATLSLDKQDDDLRYRTFALNFN